MQQLAASQQSIMHQLTTSEHATSNKHFLAAAASAINSSPPAAVIPTTFDHHTTNNQSSSTLPPTDTNTAASPPNILPTLPPIIAIAASGCRAATDETASTSPNQSSRGTIGSNSTNGTIHTKAASTSISTSKLNYSNAASSNTTPSSMSSKLSAMASEVLSLAPGCVFSPNSDDPNSDCCADSSATHMMLPDFKAFNSYRQQTGRTVKLGDNSKLIIAGEGTATFSLNGKVVTVRNAQCPPCPRPTPATLQSSQT